MSHRAGISIVIFCFGLLRGVAQQDSTANYASLFSVSMDELLSLKVTTASKHEESLLEAPLSVTVLTEKEIQNAGVTTMEEVFRLVPGLIVREESNGNYDVHIRGFDNIPPNNFRFNSENTMTLVMIDGQKVYNYLNGGVLWETLPVSYHDVSRIEVIRGPSTALYGPNAATGVINIITKKTEKSGVHVNAQSGIYNSHIGHVAGDLVSNDSKLRLNINANYDIRDRFDDLYYDHFSEAYVKDGEIHDYGSGALFSANNRWGDTQSKNKIATNAGVFYEFQDSVKIDIHAGFQKSAAQALFMETTATPYTKRVSQMNYVHMNSDIKGLKISSTYQFGRQNIYENGSGTFKIENYDMLGEYTYRFKDKVILQPGVSFQRSSYDDVSIQDENSNQLKILNGNHHVSNFSYYLRADARPIKNLRLVAAIRGDKYETPDTTYLTFQLASTYSIKKHSLIRYVFSKANRGPFIGDLFTDLEEFSVGVITYEGNRNLRMPVIFQHEIGIRTNVVKKMSMDFEFFYLTASHFTGLEPQSFAFDPGTGGVDVDFSFQNYSVRAEQLGATVMLTYQVNDDISVKSFATIQNTRLFNLEVNPDKTLPFFMPQQKDLIEEQEHPYTPSIYGGFIINGKLSNKWLVNLSSYFYSSQVYEYRISETEIPSNFLVNAVVKYNFYENHVAYVNVRNVFDSNKREAGWIDASRALVLFGLDLNF